MDQRAINRAAESALEERRTRELYGDEEYYDDDEEYYSNLED